LCYFELFEVGYAVCVLMPHILLVLAHPSNVVG
jgi:hypothetical protein